MSVREGPSTTRSTGWMVSPAWDLALIVASPIVIVPGLWLLTRSALTPDQIAIPVFAFATLGHHLPGYMRAYGDRSLFERYRLRFVVVPPLLFGVILFLVEPGLFGSPWAPPSSLQLLLVLWGAWHGLMQIYGFMRIYDAKQGGGHGRTQRLDLAVCFAIFIAGFLFSDTRSFVLFDLILRAGLPAPGAEGLALLRWITGAGVAALAIVYLANLIVERRQGRRMGGVKLALAVSTAGLYTWSGLVTTNLLLGGAVFEVFHAVQYLAIVWYFNRRLEDQTGDRFGPLRFLFRDRWSSLGLYLFAVAAFGSLFLVMGTPQYGPIRAGAGSSGALYTVFSAFFVTSSLLHYYYDGFIWKLHDRATASTLGAAGNSLSEISVPALRHFGKWATLAAVTAAVIAVEVTSPATPARQGERIVALENLAPSSPELRRQSIALALAEDRVSDALTIAQQNVALRPRSHEVRADLGRVQARTQDWVGAESTYRAALELKPAETVYLVDLARAIARQGRDRAGDAASVFERAIEAQPTVPSLRRELAQVELLRGRPGAAVRLLEPMLETEPGSLALRWQLIEALLAEGRSKRALAVAREGTVADTESAPAQRILGAALRAAQRPLPAAQAFSRAQRLDPGLRGIDFEAGQAWFAAARYRRAEPFLLQVAASENPPDGTLFMLGAIFYETNRLAAAEVAWKSYVDAAPNAAVGQRRLAGRLADHGASARAIAAYRKTLELAPNDARTHANLGRLLLDDGATRAARVEFEEAERLGRPIPPAIQARLR